MRFSAAMLEMLTSAYNRTDLVQLQKGELPESNLGKLFYLAGWGLDLIWSQTKKLELWNDIDQASGRELDRLGTNYRAVRGGMDDEDYRILIKTSLMARDSGSLDSIIHGAAALFNIQPECLDIMEKYPAKVCLTVYDRDLGEGYFERAGMIRKMLKKIAAAGVRIEIRLVLYGFFREELRYTDGITFQSRFYLRFNLPYLNLDRTWKLDGKRKLSGYSSRETVDFYPVSARFRTAAEETLEAGARVHLQASAGKREWTGSQAVVLTRTFAAYDMASGQKIAVRTEVTEAWEEGARLRLRKCVQKEVEAGEKFRVSASAPCKTVSGERQTIKTSAAVTLEAGEIQVYNKNRLDSGFRLNGRRKLNGGTELR